MSAKELKVKVKNYFDKKMNEEFVNWPYYTILDNITMLNEKDVLVIIKDRYQLLKINITKENLLLILDFRF